MERASRYHNSKGGAGQDGCSQRKGYSTTNTNPGAVQRDRDH